MKNFKFSYFKSPAFYWHTGHKNIAIISGIVSFVIMAFSFGILSLIAYGKAGIGVLLVVIALAVVLDAASILLAIAYLVFFRGYLPQLFVDHADEIAFMILFPLLFGFLINRLGTFIAAKLFDYDFSQMNFPAPRGGLSLRSARTLRGSTSLNRAFQTR